MCLQKSNFFFLFSVCSLKLAFKKSPDIVLVSSSDQETLSCWLTAIPSVAEGLIPIILPNKSMRKKFMCECLWACRGDAVFFGAALNDVQ